MTEMDEYQPISKIADVPESTGCKALPRPRTCGTLCPHLMDDEGFTTISMVVAMVLTLALLFSAAQIYRLESETAAIQEVADASALAAENVVAEFMIAVRLCDAVALSMSLLSLAVLGVSVVLLCIPPTQGLAGELIDVAVKIMEARDKFAAKATETLTKLAKSLPYLAAANAASVGGSNSIDGHRYIACALLFPGEVEEIDLGDDEAADKVLDDVSASRDELADAASKAEEAARQAQEYKMAAYLADCGRAPERCMQERAATLAGMGGAANPTFSSVDTWSFSVALKRAQDYFRTRAAQEAPLSDSVKEQSNSALRKLYYAYVNEILAKGYVRGEGTGETFACDFPLPPRNTDEMRATHLYTDATFPITTDGDATVMHAWPGCPKAAGATGLGSLAQMEAGGYAECPVCHFRASDLGKVGAASTSIATGFEYHYVEVARAAEEYEKAAAALNAEGSKTKSLSESLFDAVKNAMAAIGGHRVDITPPGAYGAIALVADVATFSVDAGLSSSLVGSAGTVGPRAAVAGATLLEEPEGESGTIISSLLDGFGADAGAVVGAARVVLDAWSQLLQFYSRGPETLRSAIDSALAPIPLLSASGLGKWAADKLSGAMEAVGLEPPELDALKPVLVNTGRVAAADESGLAARFVSIKNGALSLVNSDGSVFGDLIDQASGQLKKLIGDAAEIELACIELPFGNLKIPIVLTLPPELVSSGQGLVGEAAESLKGLIGSVVTGPLWK